MLFGSFLFNACVCSVSHVQLFRTPWTVPERILCPWDFPGKNIAVGCHFLLLFPIQWVIMISIFFQIQNCQKQTPLRILELFIINQCTCKYTQELFLKSRLKIYEYYIYISLDCFYKISQTGSLINDRNPFLIVIEAKSPRSDGQHGQVLVRTASRVLIFNFPCVLT